MGLDIADILMDIEDHFGIVIDTGSKIETIDDMVKVVQLEVAKRSTLNIDSIINGALPDDNVTPSGYELIRKTYKYLPRLEYKYKYTTCAILAMALIGLIFIAAWPLWVSIYEGMMVLLLILDCQLNTRCIVPKSVRPKGNLYIKIRDTEGIVLRNEYNCVLQRIIEIVRDRSGYSGEIIPNSRLIRDLHLG